ncbi:coproporphyrinogen III oxidase [Gemmata obscuriglobus]|uniref:B12-binding domain-containing radical SAM protein n=1 Tax=Gemmata obscuriglobus TaxID=114 RepID=A0A2Z3GTE9_9BACT|nr:radical SAM protein [Gemmata obscuriglobus]AWM36548.1 B12-binding domain-containing radical SAM protein [Gemmata obscuriglobus]QEG30827.1 coproporphyrinogen III oxidase [Gemmata obscuriglobus]VTS10158.1 fe-s osidoreductase : Putative Fe-S oxidoreductase OS=Azospirillum lipoferum (strain 4B) GN=AZOLI_p60016 PE=4 SV=1: B12-binding: Radical_SAM [Gemmata obscuriglobus UQM 2246]
MAPRLDLVLINPSSRTQVYQSLGTELAAVENPVWAGLMANFCRQKGLSVEIIDAEAECLSPSEVADRVAYLRPVLTAVVAYGHQPSASTQIMTAVSRACSAVKVACSEQPVLLLGGHVAALPERTLREEEADFVAAGEGVHTLAGLVEALKSAVPDVSAVPGLYFRDNGRVRRGPAAPLLSNLDTELPGIAWDLLPMPRYRAHNWHCLGGHERQPYAAVYTTLGCPYQCSFCCIQAPFKNGEVAPLGQKQPPNSYRFWSIDHVLGQIDTLVNKYGVRNIKIADEMFVLNKRHVVGICDGIIARGYDLNIWAYTRVDTIKDGMLPKLKAAGFNWLAVGIEAGADRVRTDVDKAFSQEQVYSVVREIQSAGISVIGNYIFGLPEDDHATMRATLDLALDLKCEFANFYSAMAYPGSPLYATATQKGIPLPRRWTGYSQHSRDSLPLPTRYLPAREVLKFRDAAFTEYYTDPGYLAMVERRFGAQSVEELRRMTAITLERDLLSGALDVEPTLLPPDEAQTTPAELLQLAKR